MSMSMHITGFQPEDDQWRVMKAAFDACKFAGVEPPETVQEFFGYEEPGDKPGREVSLDDVIKPWSDDMCEGYEIDMKAIPKNVRYLRFYCSW